MQPLIPVAKPAVPNEDDEQIVDAGIVLFLNSVRETYADYRCRCNLVPVYHYINIHRYQVRSGFLKYTFGQLSFIVSKRLSFPPSFHPRKNQKPKTSPHPRIRIPLHMSLFVQEH